MLRVGGMQLFRTESSDTSEKVAPRAAQIAGAIGKRWITVTVVLAIFAASVYGFGTIEGSFFPQSSRGQFLVDYWLPQGTSIHQTEKDIKEIEAEGFRACPETEVWELSPGDRRYVVRSEGSLVAFALLFIISARPRRRPQPLPGRTSCSSASATMTTCAR